MYQSTVAVGHLGGDPVMRYAPTGEAVCDFRLAVNRKGKDGAESVTWLSVAAWGKLAETCNAHLKKGALVLVEGTVSASAWKDKDGEPHATLQLTARTVRFLSAPASDGDPS